MEIILFPMREKGGYLNNLLKQKAYLNPSTFHKNFMLESVCHLDYTFALPEECKTDLNSGVL